MLGEHNKSRLIGERFEQFYLALDQYERLIWVRLRLWPFQSLSGCLILKGKKLERQISNTEPQLSVFYIRSPHAFHKTEKKEKKWTVKDLDLFLNAKTPFYELTWYLFCL